MIIWLTGPSGAGKTTAGRILAELRGVDFKDIDEVVEQESGQTIEHIFSSSGEQAFRSHEWNAILAIAERRDEPCVVALGAGALTQAGVRALVRATGPRVFLDIDADTAMARLSNVTPRPLLFEENPIGAWKRLYRNRRRQYEDCDITVTAAPPAGAVAREIDRRLAALEAPAWQIESVINGATTTVASYPSLLRTFDRIEEIIGGRRALFAVDGVVAADLEDVIHDPRRHLGGVFALDAGEENKTLATVERLLRAMSAQGLTRGDVIVAMGGGSITDVAGLAGSLYMRGIETLYVPTTLLAQVDAAVGGKTAVNAAGVRNLGGTVYQPRNVLVCTSFLRTLAARELRSGFVESLKMGIVNSAHLAEAVTEASASVADGRLPANIDDVVQLSVRAKLDVVEQDALDTSVRMSLNFGHTFGHALEAAEPGRHAHGEAVAFGIVAATEMAAEVLGLSETRQTLIRRSALPFAREVGAEHDVARIAAAASSDKKRTAGSFRFVLPAESTGWIIHETDDRESIVRSMERAFAAIASEHVA